MIGYHLSCLSPHSGFTALFPLSSQDDWPIGGAAGGPYHKFGRGPQLPHFRTENNASDITCGIGDIRAQILCPQTTQGRPKKQPWSRTTAYWRIVTNRLRKHKNTRHCEDYKEVCVYQRTTQRAFKKTWTGVCPRLSERWAPSRPPTSPFTFQNAPPPLWPSSF